MRTRRASNVFLSADGGDNWDGPFPTGVERATLSLVGKPFWLVERNSARASEDGMAWRDLPQGIPSGKIVASPGGTLISIDRRRFNILRSGDRGETWNEVYAFEPETQQVHGAQGLRDIVFGYKTA